MPELDPHLMSVLNEKRWFFIALAVLVSELLGFCLAAFIDGSSWPATITLGFVAFVAPALVALSGFAAFISNPPWVSH